MKKWLFSILLTLIHIHILFGQEQSKNETDNKAIHHNERWNSNFVTNIIPDQGLNYFMEHLSDDIHVHLPVEGGWDQGLPYLFSFNGASYKWTSHYLDDVKVNNILIPGDAMYHFNTGGYDIHVDRYANAVHQYTVADSVSMISFNTLIGDIGGRVGWADWFINNISGHNSAQQRAIGNIHQRIHLPYQFNLNYRKAKVGDQNDFRIHLVGGKRRNIDHDFMGIEDGYDESFHKATVAGSISGEYQYACEWQYRSHAYSEFQYAAEETSEQSKFNGSLFRVGNHSYGIHLNLLNLNYRNSDFYRNAIDQDGEGLHPYYQDGLQMAVTPFYQYKGILSKDSPIAYFFNTSNTWIRHQPETLSKTNGIYFNHTDSHYRSLHVIDWQMNSFSGWLLNNEARINFKDEDGSTRILLDGGLHLMGLLLSESSLIQLLPSIDIGIEQELSDNFQVGLRGGILPRPYDVDQLRLLSKDYMNGQAYYWNDLNNNRTVESSERGELLFTSGGKYRSIGESLGPAKTYYLDLPIQYHSTGNWKLRLISQFRSHRNTWDVQYDDAEPMVVGLNQFGSWGFIGNREVSYKVIPYNEEWMRDSEGELRSPLFNQPFYAGLTFQFEKLGKVWYIKGSATAHMIVGGSGIGNGPLHNNINQPSDLMADLNIRFRNLGRLDSDRSYLANLLVSCKYTPKGSINFLLRYRDGQSFGYYSSRVHEYPEGAQAIFIQPLPRGDDPFTGLMGRREDFLLNVSALWQHQFQYNNGYLHAGLQIYNLLDLATETSEYVYGINGDFPRAPLELQIPRTIRLSLKYQW